MLPEDLKKRESKWKKNGQKNSEKERAARVFITALFTLKTWNMKILQYKQKKIVQLNYGNKP